MLDNITILETLWDYVNPRGERYAEKGDVDIYNIAKMCMAKVFAKSLYQTWKVCTIVNEDVIVIEAQEADDMRKDYFVCDLRTGNLTRIF